RLPRHGPADEHHERRAERLGLVNDALVLLDGGLPPVAVGRREEAAAYERDDLQPLGPDAAADLGRGAAVEALAPYGDAAEPGGRVVRGGLLDAPRPRGDRVDAEPGEVGERLSNHRAGRGFVRPSAQT